MGQCNPPLTAILVLLVLDLLYLHLHAILREHHMLALHLLARVLADILDNAVDDVAHCSQDCNKESQENQREQILQGHYA